MYDETIEARLWDSEKRSSPYSTVADPETDDYCEGCDSTVDYSDEGAKHGSCKCDDAGECEGHPAGPFDPMGETVYCDGTCR